MDESASTPFSPRAKRKQYSESYKAQLRERIQKARRKEIEIEAIIGINVRAEDVDMNNFLGTEAELREAIEFLYANDGWDFNPHFEYPPGALATYGKEYELNAQGIYYRPHLAGEIIRSRNLWVPTPSRSEPGAPETPQHRARAKDLAAHAINNERWCKSEFAWEADAWADVFAPIKGDRSLEVDKHDYWASLPNPDPVTRKLTGKSTMVKRTPDATFGLATFTDRDAWDSAWIEELDFSSLACLLVNPKYGLYSDPRRVGPQLVFPFMVYEAKGWKGDCRAARAQACSAATCYLDMLDNLVREPGPLEKVRPYQTPTSHHYQVFVLTSFGAYWHLLVGYRRPRAEAEHAGVPGMSETVYVFHRIWSGHVTFEKDARELLSLVDQIHAWASERYRSFVVDHLRAWNQLCQEDYRLESERIYALMKGPRNPQFSDGTELALPGWVSDMSESTQKDLKVLAEIVLAAAMIKYEPILTSAASTGPNECGCLVGGCRVTMGSLTALYNHLKIVHKISENGLAQMRWLFKQQDLLEHVKTRQKAGLTPFGTRRMPNPYSSTLPDPMALELSDLAILPPYSAPKTNLFKIHFRLWP